MTEIRAAMDIGKKRVFIDPNVCMRHTDVSETTVLPTSYNIARARLPAMDLKASMKSHWELGTFRVTMDKNELHRLYMDHVSKMGFGVHRQQAVHAIQNVHACRWIVHGST